jgi:hypothetical protein
VADRVEAWAEAVRKEAAGVILQGGEVPGFKMVAGRKGNRVWSDPAAVEDLLRKKIRLTVDEAYTKTVITPPAVDLLRKAKRIGEKHFGELSAYVKQADPKASLAPDDDPRPALSFKPVADEFEEVTTAAPAVDINDFC